MPREPRDQRIPCPISGCTAKDAIGKLLAHIRVSHKGKTIPSVFLTRHKIQPCPHCKKYFLQLSIHLACPAAPENNGHDTSTATSSDSDSSEDDTSTESSSSSDGEHSSESSGSSSSSSGSESSDSEDAESTASSSSGDSDTSSSTTSAATDVQAEVLNLLNAALQIGEGTEAVPPGPSVTVCKTKKEWSKHVLSIIRPYADATSSYAKEDIIDRFLDAAKIHPSQKKPSDKAAFPEHVDTAAAGLPNSRQNVREAARKLQQGSIGQAARALERSTLAPNNAETVAALKALHPKAYGDTFDIEALTPVSNAQRNAVLTLDVDSLQRYIYSRQRFTAGGPSGWTFECMRDLHECEDTALAALLPIVQDICSFRDITEVTRTRLTDCRLIALQKAGGGIRPIAIGETLYRLAAGVLAQAMSNEVSAFLGPLQFGAPTRRGGVEALSLVIQTFLAENPDACVISTDVANAFNTVSRLSMLNTISAIPALAPMMHLSYGQPSRLLFTEDVTILSEEGTRQGDPLASIGFNMSLGPVLNRTREAHPDVLIVSLHDDTYILGTEVDVADAFATLETELASVKLAMKRSKCKIYSPNTDVSATALDLTISNAPDGIVAVGTPIGSQLFQTEYLAEAIDDVKKTLTAMKDIVQENTQKRSRKHPILQSVFQLLRLCTLSRVNLLTRVLPPEVTTGPITVLEDTLYETLLQLLQISLPANHSANLYMRTIATLPLRLGGMGVPHCASSLQAAFIGAWALVGVQVKRAVASLSANSAPIVTLRNTISDVQADLPNESPLRETLVAAAFLETPRTGVQHAISAALAESRRAKLLTTALADVPANYRIRSAFLSCSMPYAGAWLSILPTHPGKAMTDEQFRIAARLRLQVPLTSGIPSGAKCSLCNKDVDSLGVHALQCNKNAAGLTHRHEAVNDSLLQIIRSTGLRTAKDLNVTTHFQRRAGQANTANLKADIIVQDFDGHSRIAIDTTIGTPLPISAHAKNVAALATHAELTKRDKYQKVYSITDAQILPFSLETYGAWGEVAVVTIKKLALLQDPAKNVRSVEYSSYLRNSVVQVSLALQRANAASVCKYFGKKPVRHASGAIAAAGLEF